jgi:uncharacterized protein YbjT (DUF2867 family)
LVDSGWQVRGTTRDPGRAEDIRAARLDAVVADPERVGSVLDHVGDVTLIYWLLGSAAGGQEETAALHGSRLERLMQELVDTPVRGFVYEADGQVDTRHLERGAEIVREAERRWRIPVEVVAEGAGDWEAWTEAMLAAAERLTSARGS